MVVTLFPSTFYVLVVVGDVLRQLVPLLYLAMALYLGLVGSSRQMWNWAYIIFLGSFGVSSYMLLNEPTFTWIPVWLTFEVWFIFALVVILAIGVLLFLSAIRLQDMDTPTDLLLEFYGWVRGHW